MINIRRDVQDAFYRYKMPRLQAKIEGKGNGIKTVIPNMVDIGRALARPPSYITKYFGAELGALSTCDEKASKYIVNGAHDAEKLQVLLDGFIGKFVLCQSCENPETVLSISKKDGTINRSCQACGHRGTVDMMHKLVTFIRAHPPPKPPKKSQAKDRSNEVHEDDQEGSNLVVDSTLAPKELMDPEDFDSTLKDIGDKEKDHEEDWDEVGAEVLRNDELSHLSESVRQKLALGQDKQAKSKEDQQLEALDAFGDFIQENTMAKDDEIVAKLEDLSIPADLAVVAIVQILFATEDFVKIYKQRNALLHRLVTDEKSEKALLGSIDRLIGEIAPKNLLAKTPTILQCIYNDDLVSEEALLAWNAKVSRRYVSKEAGIKVREKARPFFEWLSQMEDTEEDSDIDDEE